MIKALIVVDKCKGHLCITIDGHANYAPKGQDLVCAAASILTMTLADTINGLNHDMLFDANIDIPVEKAHAKIEAFPKEYAWPYVYITYQTICNGLQLLEKTYPDFINVKIEVKYDDI